MQCSFLNLYRALGQPTAFNAEMRGLRPRARLRFTLRMVPSLLVLQMVVGGVVALVAHLSRVAQIAHTDRWRYQVPMVAAWVVRQGG